MTNPTQPPNIDQDRQALAPYNFVPLPERILKLDWQDLPDQDWYDPRRTSGWLECELTTSSPVYIRAGVRPEEYGRNEKSGGPEQFFYTDDENKPVIPGSSLRGLLRSLVGVASYSKVAGVSSEKLVYRAVGDTTSHGERYRERLVKFDGERNRQRFYTPLVLGGYMVKEGARDWFIRPAKTIGGTTYAVIKIDEAFFKSLRPKPGCKNASEIYIEAGPYEYQQVRGGFLQIKFARVRRAAGNLAEGLRPGTLACSGWMNSKRSEAVIFEPNPAAALLPISDELVDAYRDQLSAEQKELLGSNGVLNRGQPVFYVLNDDGSVFFFGHGRLFRVPYPNSPQDYVPEALCREEDLDLAEAIFGYSKGRQIPEGKRRSYAGRVFVSDATLQHDQQDVWLAPQKTITPRILAGPKPTTFQHYLVQTQPNRIPAGKDREGNPKYRLQLSDYASSSSETLIRGHKFYWHKGNTGLDAIRETGEVKSADTQHALIQPLRSGVKFSFKINFENLNSAELGALLWVLEIASRPEYRLKLGMGKPLGMGAVQVKASLHLIDRLQRYRQLFAGQTWNTAAQDALEPGAPGWQAAVEEFKQLVLGGIGEKATRPLEDLERIQALLAMLSWPGPDPQKTRYLEIEHRDSTARGGKRNEYRDRPVLPKPQGVWMKKGPAAESSPTKLEPQPVQQKTLQPGYLRGVVKSFGLGSSRSFGFITPDGGGADVFVHINALGGGLKDLQLGQRVVFKVVNGKKGPQAEDVRLE